MTTIVAQTTRKYKDLDLSFTAHPIKKDVNKHVDDLAVINSVKNLILTNHYERLFRPEIGSNVSKMLFEPMDTISTNLLQREITQVLTNYEPRIQLREVAVSPDYENNGYNIGMTFLINNSSEPIVIQFFLNRER
jgi:phage baseplate assembly protein W